ncbi:MAG: AAA family ATPase [Candidatus Aminicenantes bacterium]|nr:AAA family ATPase [Candidatus Aminicenantes bacterium]
MSLENLILGSIAILGKIPENLDIGRNFFKLETQRKVFSEFRKGVFNPALISEHLKKDKNISLFLSSIMEGVPHSKPSEIVKLVNEVKKDRKNIEIVKMIGAGARSGIYDFEKIKKLNREVEGLEVAEKNSNLISLDEVTPIPIQWFWYNKIPSGKITFIVGDPGAGKSLLVLYLASIISRGDDWPDVKNAPNQKKGSVIILPEEDSLDDTVRVRADTMKADVSKIKILDGMIPAKGRLEFFDIRKHLKILE